MIHQTDSSLPWPINRFGCNFMSLAAMVEWESGVELGPEDLMYVAIEAMATPKYENFVLGNTFTVWGPDELLRMMITRAGLGGSLRLYQIGADGEYWKWVKEKDVSYTILKGRTRNENEHFRLGTAKATQLYDPYPKIEVVRELSVYYYQSRRL